MAQCIALIATPRGRAAGPLAAALLAGSLALAPLAASARPDPGILPASQAPPSGLQSCPALAGAAGTVFAAWSDGRDGTLDRIYWTHFTEGPPDSLAAPVTLGAACELHAAVAADSGWALAVWESWTAEGTRLAAAELDAASAPAPREAVFVTANPGPVRRPAAAALREQGLLVWEDERVKPGDLYFARWERGSGLRDPGGLPLATGPGFRSWARATASGAGFLVVWSETTDGLIHKVVSCPVTQDGFPAGVPRVISRDLEAPTEADATAVGARWLVVWREPGNGGSDLVARFLGPDGVPLGEGAFPVSSSPGFEYGPRLQGFGVGACLLWFDQDAAGRGIRRAWIDEGGAVHPAGGALLTDPADDVADMALAVRGAEALAAWRLPLPLDDDDLYAGVFPAADTVVIPTPVPFTLVREVSGAPAPAAASRLPPRAYPNPFRHGVRLDLGSDRASQELLILDIAGRRVRRLGLPAGAAAAFWDGRTDAGEAAPPGVYLAKIPRNPKGLRLVKLP